MTVVLDTSAVMALMIASDDFHEAAFDFMNELDDDLVTSPLCVAEMDHMATKFGGRRAANALWGSLENGAYGVRWWADAMTETLAIAREHPKIGLADASLVALCRRLRTDRIATFDRHFEMFDLKLLPERN
jgi:predicted nucleic acid-binding protein